MRQVDLNAVCERNRRRRCGSGLRLYARIATGRSQAVTRTIAEIAASG